VIIGHLEDGTNLVAIAMNGWDEGHPAWWLNLGAHPEAVARLSNDEPRPSTRGGPRARNGTGSGRAGSTSTQRLLAYAGSRSTETPVVVLEPAGRSSPNGIRTRVVVRPEP
jgi:hypothetical protein